MAAGGIGMAMPTLGKKKKNIGVNFFPSSVILSVAPAFSTILSNFRLFHRG
jgi:hypothetical protein